MAILVQEHVPLRELTTLKVGGTARFFCSVSTEQDIKTAFRFARKKKLPVVVLGGGSNVLLSDTELAAVVVRNEIKGVEWGRHRSDTERRQHGTDAELVMVGAGESWDGLVEQAVRRRLWGIENLSGIPGTVGAAPIQNIGAYGAELKDVLEWVEVLDNTNYEQGTKVRTETVRRISNAECRFGYRDSIFKHKEGKPLVVTRVALRLSKNGKPNLEYKDLRERFNLPVGEAGMYDSRLRRSDFGGQVRFKKEEKDEKHPELTPADIRNAVLEIRSRKFPDFNEFGTAGSFFKNPIISRRQFDALKKKYPDLPGFLLSKVNGQQSMVKLPLAWILDNICGLKGYRRGNVALFERQPIVLINTGGATAEEIQKFSAEITQRVKEKTGLPIEWEVQKMQ